MRTGSKPFLDILEGGVRRRLLMPKTRVPGDFFSSLLEGCEKEIPAGFDDLTEYVERKAEQLDLSPEALTESISRRNHDNIDKKSDVYDAVLDLVRQRTEFEREIIADALGELELTPTERILFRTGLRLMPHVDDLFFNWKCAVPDVVNRTAVREGLERSEVAQRLMERKLDDKYSVVVSESTGRPPTVYEEGGKYEQVSYGHYFREDLREMRRQLTWGVERLEQVGSEEAELWAAFFETWGAAMENAEIGKHEELWREVDEKWVKCSGSTVMVHPMEEGYADPIRIMPEVRVLFRLAEGKEMIEAIKSRMLEWEKGEYSSHPLYPQFRRSLENTRAGVFVTPLYSGEDFDFRFSGQIVPNRSEVRLKGTKIFMDKSSCENKIEIYGRNVEKFFVPGFVRRFKEMVTPDTFLNYVIAHECGHSVLVGKDTKEIMGDAYRNVEEFKASHIGLEVLMSMDLPPDYFEALALFLAARIVRFMTKAMREDKTLEPYYLESLIQLGVLLDRDILRFDDGGLNFDVGSRRSFFDKLLTLNSELKQIYLEQDPEGAKGFLERYACRDQRVEKLFRYLDRNA